DLSKILKTKENLVRDWFIENYEHGFRFNENKSIKKVNNKAFEFISKDIKVCLERIDELGLPCLSIFFGMERYTNRQKSKGIEIFSEHSVETWKETEITFSKSCVKSTNELIKNVTDALSKKTINEK
ncbi:25257_t:CDS:2, partial [Gigaspora margarita]